MPIFRRRPQDAATEARPASAPSPSSPVELDASDGPEAARPPRDWEAVHSLDRIRFGPERELLRELEARYGLRDIVDHIIDAGDAAPFHEMVRASLLRLTPLVSPRLHRIWADVRERVAFDEPVEFFVMDQAEVNAFAHHRLDGDEPHLVVLTAGAIRLMDDRELAFVLGHEAGHLLHRHHRAGLVGLVLGNQDGEDGGRRLTPLLERRLQKWGRLTEFSADRVGFIAGGADLAVAVATFFKMASGLGPEHLQYDEASFFAQLDDLKGMSRKEVLARFSHPITPVRARALQGFAAAGGLDAPDLSATDDEIEALAGLMDFELSTDLGENARRFLVAGGLLAAHADGDMSEDEQELLVTLLLQVTGDPERYLAEIETREQADAMLEEACAWLRSSAGQERYALYQQLAQIVAVDAEITPSERGFMMDLARRLEIPEQAAAKILHGVLSHYVSQTTKLGSHSGFGLRG